MEKKAFKRKIEGKRVVLKKLPCSIKQADLTFKLVDKNRKHLLPWLQWAHYSKTQENSFEFLQDQEQKWNNKKSALYGIYLNNKYIGGIEMFKIDYEKDSGEIGYWIDSDHTGNGYMTEALKLIENYFFEYGINRVVILADEDNLASFGVAEKCGYTFEGTLRQSEYFKEGGGEYRNTKVYSKLYHEWEYYKKSSK